jgi:hypothetical protein
MPPKTTIQITEATTTHVPNTSFRVISVFARILANIKLNISATLPNGATHYKEGDEYEGLGKGSRMSIPEF